MSQLSQACKKWKFQGFFPPPLTAVYVNLLETDQSGPHFLSTCLAANHSSASLKKKSCFASWRGHTQVSLELWAGP